MNEPDDPPVRRRRGKQQPAAEPLNGSAAHSRRARLAEELILQLEERKAEIEAEIVVLRGVRRKKGESEH